MTLSSEDFEVISRLISDYAWSGRFLDDGSIQVDWAAPEITQVEGGYTLYDLNARPWQVVIHDEDLPIVVEMMDRVGRGERVSGEYRIRTQTGAIRRLRSTIQPAPSESPGQVVRFLGAARDITDEVESARQLQEASEYYKAIFDRAMSGIYLVDTEGHYVDANASAYEMLGYTKDELLATSAYDVVVATEEEIQAMIAGLQRDGTLDGETSLRRKDGSLVHVEYRAALNVTPGVHMSIMRDIRDRDSNAEAQSFLATVVNASHDAIVSSDLEGNVTSWNPGATRIFGYAEEEALGGKIVNFVPEDKLEEFKGIRARLAADESVEIETERLRRDGDRVHVALAISPIFDSSGVRVGNTAIGRDITDRHLAVESARRLREDIEASAERRHAGNAYSLTFRELTVLELIARGRSDREIAEILSISPRTAQGHVTNILAKMQAQSRTEAGVRAVRERLVE